VAEIRTHGVRFHVQRLGSAGPPVVFLHGLIMDNLSSWYFTLANPVATFAEVLLYDLRGHGRSERPPTGYHLRQMVTDLAGILDATGHDDRPVALVGNSYGALLAIAFATTHPDRVDGLVLVDGHLSDDRWAADMQATLRLEGRERDEMIVRNFGNWLGRHSERKRSKLAETAHALVHETSLVDDLGATPPYGEEQLRALRCPVLAIYGERSDIRAHGERIAAAAPDCDLRIYPGCTHSVIWEATARLRDDVVDWLSRRRNVERAGSPDERQPAPDRN
jgi:pimeloyl-ACP methyl ester carboxylesterase